MGCHKALSRALKRASWSSALSKDQTVSLFKEAMTLLIEGGIKIEEMTRVAGLEAPAIEVKATKIEENGK